MRALSPDDRNPVSRKSPIVTDDAHGLYPRLRNQEPVDGVTVFFSVDHGKGQCRYGFGTPRRNWKNLEAMPRD